MDLDYFNTDAWFVDYKVRSNGCIPRLAYLPVRVLHENNNISQAMKKAKDWLMPMWDQKASWIEITTYIHAQLLSYEMMIVYGSKEDYFKELYGFAL